MKEILEGVNVWQKKTFPEATILSKLKHLQQEVEELIDKPDDDS